MKSSIIISFFLMLILAVGCSKDNVVSSKSNNSQGSISFSIDKTNAPSNVVEVIAYLTRENYETLSGFLNLLSDSSADISFQSIPIGTWHLKIDAINKDSVVIYSGESDVKVQENVLTEVNLTLVPTGNGTGNIYISVTWGTSQNSKWVDHINNPVLSKYNTIYDNHGVGACFILKDNNNYKMWYTGISDNGLGFILYAYSDNGLNWTKYSKTPVLFPDSSGDWDSYHVSPGPVIKEDGIYKMYYSGWKNMDGEWYVGLATSLDGINWTKYQNNPILSGSDWDLHIGAQSIIKKDNTYYMFYTGSPELYGRYIYNVGVATSKDGYNWQKYSGNPVMTKTQIWEGTGVAFPSVIYENGVFKMIYEGVKQENSALGSAYSYDGYTWEKNSKNPIFKTEDCNNNWVKIVYPFQLKCYNENRIYYTGVSPIDSDNFICIAREIN